MIWGYILLTPLVYLAGVLLIGAMARWRKDPQVTLTARLVGVIAVMAYWGLLIVFNLV